MISTLYVCRCEPFLSSHHSNTELKHSSRRGFFLYLIKIFEQCCISVFCHPASPKLIGFCFNLSPCQSCQSVKQIRALPVFVNKYKYLSLASCDPSGHSHQDHDQVQAGRGEERENKLRSNYIYCRKNICKLEISLFCKGQVDSLVPGQIILYNLSQEVSEREDVKKEIRLRSN